MAMKIGCILYLYNKQTQNASLKGVYLRKCELDIWPSYFVDIISRQKKINVNFGNLNTVHNRVSAYNSYS